MDMTGERAERALWRALSAQRDGAGPPRLGAALRYAVFPGGARIRPRLTIAVATALGDPEPRLTDAAAAAIELIHSASLVHDDLPCFDDADLRRGRQTLHRAFDEPTAVLTGDALIVMASQVLARARSAHPARVLEMIATLADASGYPAGIAAGQAWESEKNVAVGVYHRAKTASLFEAACELGALSAGAEPDAVAAWRLVGEHLGRAYQVADDLADATSSASELGKDVGRDHANRRPNTFDRLGVAGSVERIERLLLAAADAIPPCAAREAMRRWLLETSLGVFKLREAPALEAEEQSRFG